MTTSLKSTAGDEIEEKALKIIRKEDLRMYSIGKKRKNAGSKSLKLQVSMDFIVGVVLCKDLKIKADS